MSIARQLCSDAEREATEIWSAAYRHGVLHGLSVHLGEAPILRRLYPADSAAALDWGAGKADALIIAYRYAWERTAAGERVSIRQDSELI